MLEPITLKNYGQSFEKFYWNRFIKYKFPTYEIYWVNYVVPITKRDEIAPNKGIKTNEELNKIGKNENDVKLAQLNYSILRGLIRVYEIIKLNKEIKLDTFIEGIIRLGTTIDSIYEFLTRIYNPNTYDPWNHSSCRDALQAWRSNTTIFETFHFYRNRLVHSTFFPKISNKYPKIGVEDNYLDWRKVTSKMKSDSNILRDFDEFHIILDEQWNKIIEYANIEWGNIPTNQNNSIYSINTIISNLSSSSESYSRSPSGSIPDDS